MTTMDLSHPKNSHSLIINASPVDPLATTRSRYSCSTIEPTSDPTNLVAQGSNHLQPNMTFDNSP